MKTAVIYRSMTGHSKKIAHAVAAALNTDVLNIKDKPMLEKIDLLFITGGIYSGTSLPDMISFIKELDNKQIMRVKKAALITSSASDKTGQDEIRKILKANGIPVQDEYRCLGSFLFMRLGHPNSSEIQGAIDFAKKLAGL